MRCLAVAVVPGVAIDDVRAADAAGIDFLLMDDDFVSDGPQLDALVTLAGLAPLTTSMGLIATVSVTHTEPFHISKNVASLDWVSRGRAGWRPAVATSDAEFDLFGRRSPPGLSESRSAALWREAAEVCDVVRRLWDSWEDDAIIRDRDTGRYIDRDKLHYVDFAGEFFSVRGPSITPRPPQGHPVVVVSVTDELTAELANAEADVAVVRSSADAAPLRQAGANARRPLVLLDVAISRGAASMLGASLTAASTSVDGILVRPAPADLRWFIEDVVPLLNRSPNVARPGSTLRTRLGLPRPANRYAPIHPRTDASTRSGPTP